MMVMAVLASTILMTGCSNPFERYIFVYPRMPVLSVPPKPVLDDVSGDVLTPYKEAADYAMSAMVDGIITEKEATEFEQLYEKGPLRREMAHIRLTSNFDRLIVWSEQCYVSIRLYNDYARAMNDSNKFYSSQGSTPYTDEHDKYQEWFKPKDR